MRHLLLIIISALVLAEDKPVPQPIEVQRAMAEYERAIYSARKAYDGLANKAAMDTVAALERAKKEYMAKGDLEGANLVAAAIKKISDGDALVTTEAKIKEATGILGTKPGLEQRLVSSRWMRMTNNTSYVFNVDKTAEMVGEGATKGAWNIEKGKLIVIWDRWGKDVIIYNDKTDSLKCENYNWTATRIKQ